jgi:AMMECR1 domain-containing protein
MRALLILALWALAGGAAAERVVIPDDSTEYRQERAPKGGTFLSMKAVTVKDQNQLRGRFGTAWAAAEVEEQAARTCRAAGMRLVYFQPGETDSQGRTDFAAVCR